MKLLVTGHDGYIGAVMVPVLQRAGHERWRSEPLQAACGQGHGALSS